MKRIILLITVLVFSHLTQAQQIVREWVYKSGNTDRGFAASSLTRNGNVILAGNYTINPAHQTMYMLLKSNLDTIWVKNGPLHAGGRLNIVQTPDNGFAYYDTERYFNPNAAGPSLQKLDANGNTKWTKQYTTGLWESGQNLLLAPDSGYFFGGTSQMAGIARTFTLGRADSLGNLKWRKHYHWHLDDFLTDIQHTRNGNIIMYGITGAPQRLKLLLVNQNGDSVLGRKITIVGDPNRHERMMSNNCIITPLSDNGFLMAAEIDTLGGKMLGMVVKVNANLQLQWHYINRTLPNNVVFIKAKELTDSSVVVLGFTNQVTTGTQNNQFFLYHFSKRGVLQNIYPFTSAVGTQIRPLILEALPDSSFIIGGRAATTTQSLPLAFYLAKVKIPGLAPAMPAPAIVSSTKSEFLTTEFALGQSYPNPTASEAIIPYSLPKNYNKASIIIREIATGREIRKFDLKPNSKSLTVDVSNLSDGLYLYSLVVDGNPVATKKLAVMK